MIDELCYWYISKRNGIDSAFKLLRWVNNKIFSCKILLTISPGTAEYEFVKRQFIKEKISFQEVDFNSIENVFYEKSALPPSNYHFIEIEAKTKDPNAYIRDTYEYLLKTFVTSHDRISLSFFNSFLDNSYWRFVKAASSAPHLYRPTKIRFDPINTIHRKSTLFNTVTACGAEWNISLDSMSELPFVPGIAESVYSYNMALRSKSIENSLSLLWTALEALVPFRFKDTDIENVQNFVAPALSLGVIGRQIMSFARRYTELCHNIPTKYNNIEFPKTTTLYTSSAITEWADWLSTDFTVLAKPLDPFSPLKDVSELLCSKFLKLNTTFTSDANKQVAYFKDKISKSETAIKFQLDRIYLHRNQVIHAGKWITEYTNLWSHLEWYVGKLLSYAYLKALRTQTTLSTQAMFIELEQDSLYMRNLVARAERDTGASMIKARELAFKHSWQFF